ncbi:hypothetical protein HDU93_006673 [Gonapodya sp. JEL0774]|nr:hypothetical protein HDU93_006673 [Gonapodya sp. JEL0774]
MADDESSRLPDITDLGYFATSDSFTPEETLWGNGNTDDFVPSHLVPKKQSEKDGFSVVLGVPAFGRQVGVDEVMDENEDEDNDLGPPRKKFAMESHTPGLESRQQPSGFGSKSRQPARLSEDLTKLAQARWKNVSAQDVDNVVEQIWEVIVEARFENSIVGMVEISGGLEVREKSVPTHENRRRMLLAELQHFSCTVRLAAPQFLISYSKHPSSRFAVARKEPSIQNAASAGGNPLLPALLLLPFIASLLAHLEIPAVRAQVARVTGVGMWSHITEDTRKEALDEADHVKKSWDRWNKRVKEADHASRALLLQDAAFIPSLISHSLRLLHVIPQPPHAEHVMAYVIDFVIDILSTVPTRRYADIVIRDSLFVEELQSSPLLAEGKQNKHKQSADQHALLPLLLKRLEDILTHPIDPLTGAFLDHMQVRSRHAKLIARVQREAFSNPTWKRAYESLAMPGAGKVGDGAYVASVVRSFPNDLVTEVCKAVGVRTRRFDVQQEGREYGKEFLVRTVARRMATPKGLEETVAEVGAWPDEASIFTPLTASIPPTPPPGLPLGLPLPLPKLSLQYLSHPDALLRHLYLARIEAFSAIRTDLEDAVSRVAPTYNADKGMTTFAGWARMAIPLENCKVSEVGPPRVLGADRVGGTEVPSFVKADLTFSLHRASDVVRREWDALTPRDVVFLITCGPRVPESTDPLSHLGILHIRTAEILDLLDTQGRPLEGWSRAGGTRAYELETEAGVPDVMPSDAPTAPKWRRDDEPDGKSRKLTGMQRTYRVLLDPIKFSNDLIRHPTPSNDPTQTFHSGFNLLVRRKPAENNFKPLLETIRDLVIQGGAGVPSWLQDVYLGYGDVKEVGGFGVKDPVRVIDVGDGLGGWNALQSWAKTKGWVLKPKADNLIMQSTQRSTDLELTPPYVLSFAPPLFTGSLTGSHNPNLQQVTPGSLKAIRNIVDLDERDWKEISVTNGKSKVKEKPKDSSGKGEGGVREVVVRTYKEVNMGPFPEDLKRRNTLQFTPTQIDAILSGVRPGLTLVVGPPGTGKTDVAVQIISSLYHNFPTEHILLVTHSNQALNHIFEKIAQIDIDPRHLLRLGHGEEELEVEGDWGKFGRVNAFLDKRLRLLGEVQRLKDTLGIPGEHHGTCETAGYFFLFHILTRWDPYWSKVKQSVREARAAKDKQQVDAQEAAKKYVVGSFPFDAYFSSVLERSVFPETSELDDLVEIAAGCFRHIRRVFDELEEVRAFELLRTNHDRSNYLLVKEARVVAMTCTHAGLKRRELVRLGFKYDTVIMEEAAQVTEVESFIPMALQIPEEDGGSRLRRLIMIGDHNQLPPVVKDISLQRHSNMEQSLFTRFIRLGVPCIELDQQGRSRPSITDLYRWRYRTLHDMQAVVATDAYRFANPGFGYEYQLVDVGDFQGKGETEPLPWFYQNLGEAEYVVAVYQYMRLLGYPADKIAILTTYNGQKELIKDVLQQRCAWNPLFGRPSKVTTVDKYQGQQNDYILLSLVRTRSVGHLRDIRRLIVAMSRARLGLYIFCRKRLFQNSVELEPTFAKLLEHRDKLVVRSGERYGEMKRALSGDNGSEDGDGSFEIDDVQHMGRYVFQMTQEVIAWAKKQKAEREASEAMGEQIMDTEMDTKED